MKKLWLWGILCLWAFHSVAQDPQKDSTVSKQLLLDSLFIQEIEQHNSNKKIKILHAEPLYIDLIRDLGARKGEKEWNLGFGLTDQNKFDKYEALIEYEWAPVNRLGFEIEVPLTFYTTNESLEENIERPSNRIESLKLATQWSFWVSEKHKATLALGYIHEFELENLNTFQLKKPLKGNSYNPFFIVAKRWGNNYHSLIYTGPIIEKEFKHHTHIRYGLNTNFHYMVPGTRNFIGMEINQEITAHKTQTVLRPQMRLGLAENLMIGIVTGIPVHKNDERLSTFLRLIYEPNSTTMH